MIRRLHIQNYKSLFDVSLEVGRFNLFIGENGSGKSNLLEAMTFAAASAANKLDNEFLNSRGIRVTEPKLMRSAFEEKNLNDEIRISFNFENSSTSYILNNKNSVYSKWFRIIDVSLTLAVQSGIEISLDEQLKLEEKRILDEKRREEIIKNEILLKDFVIFSPENSALRNFSKEGQIEPLGINGEGLLKLLKVTQAESPELIEEIDSCLQLFGWYEKMEIPTDLYSEEKITIIDRYLKIAFDQRSANEGFLFILFYITLMVSQYTPKIFAIDNIDTSLNPKLCTRLIIELTRLAEKYDKQVFITTHNPAILDGIDLNDDEQRLFVVSRNRQGHTRFKRIEAKDKPLSSTDEALKLSEAFLRGYLGGLPKGF